MRTLYAAYLTIFFLSASTGFAQGRHENGDDVPPKAVYEMGKLNKYVVCLEPSLCEDERFKTLNMSYCWNQFVQYEIDSYNDKDKMHTEHQHKIEARKGVHMLIRRSTDVFAEKINDDSRSLLDLSTEDVWDFLMSNPFFRTLVEFVGHLLHDAITYWTYDKTKQLKPEEGICQLMLDSAESNIPVIELVHLLPSCPCTYPTGKYRYAQIYDRKHNKEYWWYDILNIDWPQNIFNNWLDKSKLVYCSRHIIEDTNKGKAAQYCCYDKNYKLLTHGPAAGNTYYISKNITAQMEKIFELYPMVQCNLFNSIKKLRPNNGNNCENNP